MCSVCTIFASPKANNMRKFFTLLLFAMCAIVVFATKWTPETLPMVYLQDASQYVCNPDGVLSADATQRTNLLLKALEKDKGIQTVVVVVKQLEGDDPYQFGMDLARKYGIGNKQRTGLIVILATEDRSYQILTGNGLEGTLPDGICRRIQNRVMIPELKRGDWDAAIVKTIQSIDKYVRSDASLKADANDTDDSDAWLAGFVIFGLITFFSFAIYNAQTRKKCPKCHAKMKLVKEERVRHPQSKIKMIHRLWVCPKCGNKFDEWKDIPKENLGSSLGSGPIILGGFGGGRGSSGGGSIGGSFGGGSFGGGGSGGRF